MSESLEIKTILLTDGSGKKTQNCAFCSSFLLDKGFKSESHIDGIKNYNTPSAQQLAQVSDWYRYLVSSHRQQLRMEGSPICYTYIGGDLGQRLPPHEVEQGKVTSTCHDIYGMLDPISQSKALSQSNTNVHPLKWCFDVVRQDYTDDLLPIEGLKNTYHLSNKLAHPEKYRIERTVNRRGDVTTSVHNNDRLRFFSDGRIKISETDKHHLAPVDPGSPRSRALAKQVNEWIDHGGTTSRITANEPEGVIDVRRNVRAVLS